MIKCKILLLGALFCSISATRSEPTISPDEAWRKDWAIEPGFSLEVDSEGYNFPTAIAFVPNPGPKPNDPLYFVTELRGKVKVVTNDRTVYTFAENFFDLVPRNELPSTEGQGGLAGICLQPDRGLVFVTFAYQDSANVLRNNVVRFQSKAGTFSTRATAQKNFTEIFRKYESSLAHQIGGCQVVDDLVYIGVGDGYQVLKSQQTNALLGKIVRMTLDGEPAAENPFYQDSDHSKAGNYVWAYGLRNPFSMKMVQDRLFVADNGVNIDRFLEAQEGENYFWNGHDWSISTNASFVFVPSHAPTQMDYYPAGSSIFPIQYENNFFVGTAGTVKEPGPAPRGKTKGILTFKFGFAENRLLSVPRFLLKYQGNGYQAMVGLAFGADGLYFAPLFPNSDGRSAVFKVKYDPDNPHPYTLKQSGNPLALMNSYGCLSCHSMNNQGGSEGPPLDRDVMIAHIQERLTSQEYLRSLASIDASENEPYASFKEARKEVVEAKNLSKVRIWMKYHLMQPKFDNPYSQMPYFGFTEDQALGITDYLMGSGEKRSTLKTRIAQFLPSPVRYRHLFFSFLGGMMLTAFVMVIIKFRSQQKGRKQREASQM